MTNREVEKRYSNEANRLSRSINCGLVLEIIGNNGLGGDEIRLYLLMLKSMDSCNTLLHGKLKKDAKVGFNIQALKCFDKSLKKLCDSYLCFRYERKIMVNPNVCCLTMYRNVMYRMKDKWDGKYSKIIIEKTKGDATLSKMETV